MIEDKTDQSLFEMNAKRPEIHKREPMHGRTNHYTCGHCKGKIVTVDRELGTTPFMILCRAKQEDGRTGCGGRMESAMYRVEQEQKADFEWFKPTVMAGLNRAEIEHVSMGGLLIRKIDPDLKPGQQDEIVQFSYTNHRGVKAQRRVLPHSIWFGESKFHAGRQWFMTAYCLDRKEHRDFALVDMLRT